MLQIHQSRKFLKDLKKCKSRNLQIAKLKTVVALLAEPAPIPARCRPHKLVGDYSGYWECHIAPDWLLIYSHPDEKTLKLERTGTHSDLFR